MLSEVACALHVSPTEVSASTWGMLIAAGVVVILGTTFLNNVGRVEYGKLKVDFKGHKKGDEIYHKSHDS